MARVIVFGSLNVDFVTRVPAIPRPGETIKGPSYVVLPGGKGANQALAAARAGALVAMAGAVGRDPFADIALANLRAAGVDCLAVARVDAPTGAAFISVDPAGENAIAVASGANAEAKAASLAALALQKGDILLMQREAPDRQVMAAKEKARAAGAAVVLNVAPAEGVDPALIDGVDHLILNEHEARLVAEALGLRDHARRIAAALGGVDEASAIAQALRRRSGDAMSVVITLGGAGALLCNRDGVMRAPALKLNVVDTTGAGDAFCGAYAAWLASGRSDSEALVAGTKVAGLACTGLGAQSGLPSAETIRLQLPA